MPFFSWRSATKRVPSLAAGSKSNRRRRLEIEGLEERFTPATIPVSGVRDLVYDQVRDYLYMSTTAGKVERYDVQSQSLLAPLSIGLPLNGFDITPDASALYVTGEKGTIRKVNLSTHAIESLTFTPIGSENSTFDIAIADNGIALFSSGKPGSGFLPLREIDVATDTVSSRNLDVVQNTTIARAADRSQIFLSGPGISSGPMFTYVSATDTVTPERGTNMYFAGSVAVSRNGSLMARQQPGLIAVFDSNYNFVENLPNLDGGFAFSPVDDLLIAGDTQTNTLVAFDTKTWAEMYRIPAGAALAGASGTGPGTMTFSSDGRRLFVVESAGVLQFALPESAGIASSLSISGVSKFLPASGATTTFTVIAKDNVGNIATGYRGTVHFTVPTDAGASVPHDYEFTEADAGVHTFTLSLATVGTHSLAVSDATNGFSTTVSELQVYDGPATKLPIANARDLVFDASRNRLYATTSAGTLERFDVATGTLLSPLTVSKMSLNGLDISLDGTTLLVADGQRNAASGALRTVALATGSSKVVSYDLFNGEHGAYDVSFAANGLAIFETAGSIGLRSLDPTTGVVTAFSNVGQGAAMARSEDRRRLFLAAQGNSQGPMWIYDSTTSALSAPRRSEYASDGPVAVSRSGALLARELGNSIAIFDANYQIVENLPNFGGGFAFSPVSDLFIATDVTNKVLIAFDTNTWQEKYRIATGNIPGGTSGSIGAGVMVFSSDGSRIFQIQSSGVFQYILPQATGVASSLVVDGLSKYTSSGVANSFTITVKDAAGNIASGYRGTVHISVPTDSGASLPMDYTFTAADAGVHSFTVSFGTVGTHNLTVNDAANALSRTVTGIAVHAPGQIDLLSVAGARDLIFDGLRNRLYVTTTMGRVERFDLTTGSLLSPIVAAKTPLNGGDITPDGRFLVVAEGQRSATQGSLRTIDLETGVIGIIRYDLARGEDAAWDVNIDANGTALFVGQVPFGSGWVPIHTVNLANGAVTNGTGVRQNAQVIVSANRQQLFVLESRSTLAYSYNATTGSLGPPVDLRVVAGLSAVSRDGSLLAYTGPARTDLRRSIELSTVAQTIAARGGSVVFDPNADILYIADVATNRIFRFDTNTWAQLAAFNIGETLVGVTQFGPGVMAIAADSSRLFLRTPSGIRTYFVGPEPVASAISPAQGPAPGGTAVVITGSNLLATTGVTFGGVAAKFVVDSATQITAISPPRNSGTVDIVVANPAGNSTATTAARFTYEKAAPTITWANPADIVYGVPLGAAQLNAAASVTGTFTYSLPSGTVLHAGQNQLLTVTFTPTEGGKYTTVQKTVTINVARAPLIIRANDITVTGFYVFTPPLTATYIGLVNGDTPASIPKVAISLRKPATGPGGIVIPPRNPSRYSAGTYQIIVSSGISSDYAITYVTGTLTVLPS